MLTPIRNPPIISPNARGSGVKQYLVSLSSCLSIAISIPTIYPSIHSSIHPVLFPFQSPTKRLQIVCKCCWSVWCAEKGQLHRMRRELGCDLHIALRWVVCRAVKRPCINILYPFRSGWINGWPNLLSSMVQHPWSWGPPSLVTVWPHPCSWGSN